MLLSRSRQVGASALFGTLLGHRHALPEGSRHFARCHGVSTAASMVVDAVNRARKLYRRLPQQCGNAHAGMSPINQR